MRDVTMTDSSSKSSSVSRLVGSPEDRDAATARWQSGRRRLAALCRPSLESNVVVLVCSALATIVTILLAVNVYWLHSRVRVLELHCITRPDQWTDDASQVRQ